MPTYSQTVLIIILKIVAILIPLLLAVAYFTYAERRIIGSMQSRIGPNRVGPAGTLQPIADAMKLLFKEIVIPAQASKNLFLFAPILAITPALAAWYVILFDDTIVLSDINAGFVYVFGITSMGF